MWALGLNTGVLDASNLAWRLAWVLRGWADPALLAEYEREQAPVAISGSGEMAEAARAAMGRRANGQAVMGEGRWGNAYTRTLLGVRLDVEGSGDWSMVRTGDTPAPVRVGDRAPDLPVFGEQGRTHLHRLVADSFVALHFVDARHGPRLPPDQPGLVHYVVSRWDAPHNSGLRHRALFDPGERVRRRFAVSDNTVVLVRPDAHVAAILPEDAEVDVAGDRYREIVRRPVVRLAEAGSAR
jgi:3-(3-hydroxy-phenyl)propionate hydroxylase